MVNAEKLVVTLTGGAPWGFRLSGGGGLPLIINKIRKKSPAHKQGLKEGDAVLTINGIHVHDKSQDQALELVEKATDSLALEIYRGDTDEISMKKDKKPIQIPHGVLVTAQTTDDTNFEASGAGFTLTATVDDVSSDAFQAPASTSADTGFTLTATVDDVSGTAFSAGPDVSSGGFTLTSSVDEMTSSTTRVVESSPVLVVGDAGMSTSIHSAEVEAISASATSPVLMAEPYVDSTVIAEHPERLSPNPPRSRSRSNKGSKSPHAPPKTTLSPVSPVQNGTARILSPQSNGPKVTQQVSPKPQQISPKPQKFSPQNQNFNPQPQAFSPQPQAFSPQPQTARSPLQVRSPNPPATSPKPQPPPTSPKPVVAPTPIVHRSINTDSSSGVTTSVSTSTFDDGNTRREVTHQVQRSGDGRSSTTVRRETTTTTSKGPKPFSSPSSSSQPTKLTTISKQSSAFNVVQPATNGLGPQRNISSSTTTSSNSSTLKTTTRGPPQQQQQLLPPPTQLQYSNISNSRSTGDLFTPMAPMFKPSRFVPGSGKKEIPGLYAPGSPVVDTEGNVGMGKENMAPQPRFQVKNIFSDQERRRSRDIWRPNVWLPDQKPSLANDHAGPETPTPRDDFSPYNTFPVPKVRPGYSLVQEQKKRLETQTSRSDFDFDYYDGDSHADDHHHHRRRHGKLHVFAPPVEIHADGVYDSPSSPYITYDPRSGEPIYMYEFEEGPSSPESTRRKNLYSDSAFYDTPGRNYPTITEQMRLCKKIAQSLTSAANRRARGAKMFMRRKRKSGKWVHEGHSEWSSSAAGDVANIRDLDSELSPDEGGSKPLLYFKIPNLKNRVGSKAKQTKMALTQEQFERLRLDAKKCEHNAVPPDTCFGIVADLKAHKGKGGRMFERRRERTDKYVIDDSNARAGHQPRRLDLSQPLKQDKSPWEAAMEHGGNVDAAFSHLTEWERNQRLNAMYHGASRKAPVVPLLSTVQKAPIPAIQQTSLKGDSSAFILRGKDFNRVARGWRGGGEYPVAERLQHVSPTRQSGPSSPNINYNNKIRAWQTAGQSPYAPTTTSPLPEPQRAGDQWASRRHDDWQQQQQHSSRLEYRPLSAPQNLSPVRPVSWQSESYHSGVSRDDDYTYAPMDYRYAPDSYPTVAYMQPIIPGTDC